MKVFSIALKDTLRSLRAPFSLAMMFVAPLLVAGLLYFAFGSLKGGGDLEVPEVDVYVANLDRGLEGGGFTAGEQLVTFLESEDLAFEAHYDERVRFDAVALVDDAERVCDRLRSATSGRAEIVIGQ